MISEYLTKLVILKNLDGKLVVFGELRTVIIGGLAVNRIETWRFPGENTHPFMNLPDPETVYGHGHIPLYKDFYEAIANDRDPYIPGEEGRKAVDIVLGIYRSWHEKALAKMPFEFSTKALG